MTNAGPYLPPRVSFASNKLLREGSLDHNTRERRRVAEHFIELFAASRVRKKTATKSYYNQRMRERAVRAGERRKKEKKISAILLKDNLLREGKQPVRCCAPSSGIFRQTEIESVP